jgi:hypothetical protein
MIAIVDYKAGNLTSVQRALEFLGHKSEITDRAERIVAADRVILPGVGAAGATMENLHALGLVEVLRNDVASAGKPFLGICIGIQVLLDRSEEDNAECLGIIAGRVGGVLLWVGGPAVRSRFRKSDGTACARRNRIEFSRACPTTPTSISSIRTFRFPTILRSRLAHATMGFRSPRRSRATM